MDEEAPAATPTPGAAPAMPPRADAVVDLWAADFSIPSYYAPALRELKRRLSQEG